MIASRRPLMKATSRLAQATGNLLARAPASLHARLLERQVHPRAGDVLARAARGARLVLEHGEQRRERRRLLDRQLDSTDRGNQCRTHPKNSTVSFHPR